MPPQYWVESLHTTTYMLNRLPTKIITVSCPYTALYNTLPAYEHLRVFVCACYHNLSATAPHKLVPRFTRCIFMTILWITKGIIALISPPNAS
jgi:hypothetical protein